MSLHRVILETFAAPSASVVAEPIPSTVVRVTPSTRVSSPRSDASTSASTNDAPEIMHKSPSQYLLPCKSRGTFLYTQMIASKATTPPSVILDGIWENSPKYTLQELSVY